MSLVIKNEFLTVESAGGLVLLFSALLAIILANSPLAAFQLKFIDTFIFYINEGLMAFFFLLVTLELKRNYFTNTFAPFSQISLSLIAAAGGMVVPILFYVLINYQQASIKGWATPAATDIAFALGVLSLFSKRIPQQLKLFLLSLAIFDDIGAIIIIAIVFTQKINLLFLGFSGLCVLLLFLLNRYAITQLFFYLLLGILLWFALLKSGVHPTLAGVMLALFIPFRKNEALSPLHKLEHFLHPWVAYVIMPLFALANAGISFQSLSVNVLNSSVVLGIAGGLFIGKQLGVVSFSYLWVRLGFSKLPARSTWGLFYGVAILCGIGFTMSLFLGTLSFHNEDSFLAEVRLGVLLGSFLSGLAGALVLWAFSYKARKGVKYH